MLPNGKVIKLSQLKAIQMQFPSWQGVPVIISVNQALIIAMIIGE